MAKKPEAVSQEQIESAVLVLRGEKVLLDADLAAFYGVEVRALNQAVTRNIDRFPEDFAFRLTQQEVTALRSQIVTSNDPETDGAQAATASGQPLRSQIVILERGRGQHRKYPPYAFTEQGVAMLSSVLRSKRAVQVNVEIMRAFVRLRKVLAVSAELARRLDDVEKRLGDHDEQFIQVIRAIRQLMDPPPRPRRRIGFQRTPRRLPNPPQTARSRDEGHPNELPAPPGRPGMMHERRHSPPAIAPLGACSSCRRNRQCRQPPPSPPTGTTSAA